MILDLKKRVEIMDVMKDYLNRARPPQEIRHQVDLDYTVENQNVVIFEIRPSWSNPQEKQENNIAKATFVKKTNKWKVYWLRSDMKWHSYKPKPEVSNLRDFVKEVEEDKYGCFLVKILMFFKIFLYSMILSLEINLKLSILY